MDKRKAMRVFSAVVLEGNDAGAGRACHERCIDSLAARFARTRDGTISEGGAVDEEVRCPPEARQRDADPPHRGGCAKPHHRRPLQNPFEGQTMHETEIRAEIVAAYRELSCEGMNKGASGNVSARCGDHMLITPSGIPGAQMVPEQVAKIALDDGDGAWEGPCKPSTEWRFHRAILASRADAGAVVHTHAPFSTILSILRKPIPAVHYMMAAFGTTEIRCCDYTMFGTEELAKLVLETMDGSAGCLMANHGMVVAGPDMTRAMWLAGELELLASQYYHSLLLGKPHILSDAEIEEAAKSFASYGPQAAEG